MDAHRQYLCKNSLMDCFKVYRASSYDGYGYLTVALY